MVSTRSSALLLAAASALAFQGHADAAPCDADNYSKVATAVQTLHANCASWAAYLASGGVWTCDSTCHDAVSNLVDSLPDCTFGGPYGQNYKEVVEGMVETCGGQSTSTPTSESTTATPSTTTATPSTTTATPTVTTAAPSTTNDSNNSTDTTVTEVPAATTAGSTATTDTTTSTSNTSASASASAGDAGSPASDVSTTSGATTQTVASVASMVLVVAASLLH